MLRSSARTLAPALALVATACNPPAGSQDISDAPPPVDIALFSSLPIAFPEGGGPGDLLAGDGVSHWAAATLRAKGDWRALDWIAPLDDGSDPLADIELLVMAQPRPLAPEENVALDRFVRRGGTVLLFADPVLTQESRFALGDRRRPQHTVLLSPILTRWGLELERDDEDEASEARWRGLSLPLAAPGRFRVQDDLGEFAGDCATEADARIVTCAIGKGRLLAFADAALLEPDDSELAEIRGKLLERMIGAALGSESGKSRERNPG